MIKRKLSDLLSGLLSKQTGFAKEEIISLLENPLSFNMGDVAFPCFALAKKQKKSPNIIAVELAGFLEGAVAKLKIIEKVEAAGGYVNFYFNRELYSSQILTEIFRQKEKYGNNKSGKGKKIIIEMSSPNIAKPFGIGHLRSTIIGESLSRIYKANGYKVIKINYLGDWGAQFGRLIYGIKKWGDDSKMKEDPINHLQDLYVKTNLEINNEIEAESRDYFKLMESGDKKILKLWKDIRNRSLKEFNKIYSLLGVSFDVLSGESEFAKKSKEIIKELISKGIARESQGSIIVDLEDEGKSVGILKKSDGTTVYLSRDIAAAIDRKKKYKFDEMIYEVGAEQKLHFQQLFAILDKMGCKWSSNLRHVAHGLYLGADRKKLSTRKGSSVKMRDIWNYVFNKITNELRKRQNSNLKKEDLERAKKIVRAAIFYADLSNYRENNVKYNLDAIVLMEGDTGPYLLYSYARCRSILKKLSYVRPKKLLKFKPTNKEYSLISKFIEFPELVLRAKDSDDPSIIAKYSMKIAKEFNSFYAHCRVKGSSRENYRAQIIDAYSIVLKNSLNLIGIKVIEKM